MAIVPALLAVHYKLSAITGTTTLIFGGSIMLLVELLSFSSSLLQLLAVLSGAEEGHNTVRTQW